MTRFLMIFAMLNLLAAPAMADKANLNPEWGTAAYQAPSLFIPDAEEGKPIREKVLVIFHGFKSAVPNGTFKRVYKVMKDTHTVIGVNYDYLDVTGTVGQLDALAKDHLSGREVVVFGTSLGGFWADWLAHRIKAKQVVVLNPVIKPSETLAKYIGKTIESERRAISFVPTDQQIAAYDQLTVLPNSATASVLLVTMDDDRALYEQSVPLFQARENATVQTFDTGGHTVNLKKHPARDAIRKHILGQ